MADGQAGGEFVEGGVRMFLNVGRQFFGVELAPLAPAGFRGERPRLGGGKVAIDRAPGQVEAAGRRHLGTPGLKKFHHPFA
jgi:hypothetical protein